MQKMPRRVRNSVPAARHRVLGARPGLLDLLEHQLVHSTVPLARHSELRNAQVRRLPGDDEEEVKP